jgi:hypothetical protein
MSLHKDAAFDFIMRISKNAVSCFLRKEQGQWKDDVKNTPEFSSQTVHIPFLLSENISENISILTNSIKEAVIQSEHIMLKRLEKMILLLDFGALKRRIVKLEASNNFTISAIKAKIEAKMDNKIISINYIGINENFKLFEVLSISKPDIQIILDVVSSNGIEVLEIEPDFKFVAENSFHFFQSENFTLLKFSNNLLESGNIKNGLISNYCTYQSFGLNGIFSELENILNIDCNSLIKMIRFYNTTSKVDRLKTYYDREGEDFEIKHFIENTNLILNLQNGLKKIMDKIISEIKNKNEINEICFYYAGENEFYNLNQLRLDKFTNYPVNLFDFSNLCLNKDNENQALEEKKQITDAGIFFLFNFLKTKNIQFNK